MTKVFSPRTWGRQFNLSFLLDSVWAFSLLNGCPYEGRRQCSLTNPQPRCECLEIHSWACKKSHLSSHWHPLAKLLPTYHWSFALLSLPSWACFQLVLIMMPTVTVLQVFFVDGGLTFLYDFELVSGLLLLSSFSCISFHFPRSNLCSLRVKGKSLETSPQKLELCFLPH